MGGHVSPLQLEGPPASPQLPKQRPCHSPESLLLASHLLGVTELHNQTAQPRHPTEDGSWSQEAFKRATFLLLPWNPPDTRRSPGPVLWPPVAVVLPACAGNRRGPRFCAPHHKPRARAACELNTLCGGLRTRGTEEAPRPQPCPAVAPGRLTKPSRTTDCPSRPTRASGSYPCPLRDRWALAGAFHPEASCPLETRTANQSPKSNTRKTLPTSPLLEACLALAPLRGSQASSLGVAHSPFSVNPSLGLSFPICRVRVSSSMTPTAS